MIPAGFEVVGSLDLKGVGVCGSFGFGCWCLSIAKLTDTSIASFVC